MIGREISVEVVVAQMPKPKGMADFMKQGIRANAICPGTVQSPSLDQRIADQARATNTSIDDVRQAFIDRQPMGRLGTPEEIAMAALYLASDESAFVTGTTFLIEGVCQGSIFLLQFPNLLLDFTDLF